jgi:hypothetical protein
VSDTGIIKPLRERIKQLEIIEREHQKLTGELMVKVKEKEFQIEQLKNSILNFQKSFNEVINEK